jgi:hypothetical protein
MLKVSGIDSLTRHLKDIAKERETNLVANRKNMAHDLTVAIFSNTPVWSGQAITSMFWSNSEAYIEGIQGNGEYGATNAMVPMGNEPMRRWAQETVMARLNSLDFGLKNRVVLTFGAPHWPLINVARAPWNPPRQTPRNRAVVLDIAVLAIKSAYKSYVKFKD